MNVSIIVKNVIHATESYGISAGASCTILQKSVLWCVETHSAETVICSARRRTASSALGPAQHARDQTFSHVYAFSSLTGLLSVLVADADMVIELLRFLAVQAAYAWRRKRKHTTELTLHRTPSLPSLPHPSPTHLCERLKFLVLFFWYPLQLLISYFIRHPDLRNRTMRWDVKEARPNISSIIISSSSSLSSLSSIITIIITIKIHHFHYHHIVIIISWCPITSHPSRTRASRPQPRVNGFKSAKARKIACSREATATIIVALQKFKVFQELTSEDFVQKIFFAQLPTG